MLTIHVYVLAELIRFRHYTLYKPKKTIARQDKKLAHRIQSPRVLAINIQDISYDPKINSRNVFLIFKK